MTLQKEKEQKTYISTGLQCQLNEFAKLIGDGNVYVQSQINDMLEIFGRVTISEENADIAKDITEVYTSKMAAACIEYLTATAQPTPLQVGYMPNGHDLKATLTKEKKAIDKMEHVKQAYIHKIKQLREVTDAEKQAHAQYLENREIEKIVGFSQLVKRELKTALERHGESDGLGNTHNAPREIMGIILSNLKYNNLPKETAETVLYTIIYEELIRTPHSGELHTTILNTRRKAIRDMIATATNKHTPIYTVQEEKRTTPQQEPQRQPAEQKPTQQPAEQEPAEQEPKRQPATPERVKALFTAIQQYIGDKWEADTEYVLYDYIYYELINTKNYTDEILQTLVDLGRYQSLDEAKAQKEAMREREKSTAVYNIMQTAEYIAINERYQRLYNDRRAENIKKNKRNNTHKLMPPAEGIELELDTKLRTMRKNADPDSVEYAPYAPLLECDMIPKAADVIQKQQQPATQQQEHTGIYTVEYTRKRDGASLKLIKFNPEPQGAVYYSLRKLAKAHGGNFNTNKAIRGVLFSKDADAQAFINEASKLIQQPNAEPQTKTATQEPTQATESKTEAQNQEITLHKHTSTQGNVSYIVRAYADTKNFKELCKIAKDHTGRYNGNQSIKGFLFKNEAHAQAFKKEAEHLLKVGVLAQKLSDMQENAHAEVKELENFFIIEASDGEYKVYVSLDKENDTANEYPPEPEYTQLYTSTAKDGDTYTITYTPEQEQVWFSPELYEGGCDIAKPHTQEPQDDILKLVIIEEKSTSLYEGACVKAPEVEETPDVMRYLKDTGKYDYMMHIQEYTQMHPITCENVDAYYNTHLRSLKGEVKTNLFEIARITHDVMYCSRPNYNAINLVFKKYIESTQAYKSLHPKEKTQHVDAVGDNATCTRVQIGAKIQYIVSLKPDYITDDNTYAIHEMAIMSGYEPKTQAHKQKYYFNDREDAVYFMLLLQEYTTNIDSVYTLQCSFYEEQRKEAYAQFTNETAIDYIKKHNLGA